MAWSIIRRLGRCCDVWVITYDQNRAAIEEQIRQEPLPAVHFHYVGLPRWIPFWGAMGSLHIYAYLWQWAAYFAARRLHREIRFDIAHQLTYENDWMASIIGALLPVAYVRGPCGGAHRIPRPFLRRFSPRARMAERVRSFGQWLFRHDPFFALSQSRARAILACNNEAQRGVAARWRHKVHLMSINGVSADELAPLPPRASNGKFRVLSAGRLIPLKGFDLSLRAFRFFAEKCPVADFTIVGEGPELPALQEMIRDLGLEGRARIERRLPREEYVAALRDSDVFLFLSLRDGGGQVVVEAMAGGTPVVALDLGGPGLHVNDECGVKIPAHSPEQVVRDGASALELLFRDRGLLERLSQGARRRAADFYDWDRISESIGKIYEDVLAAPSSEA